MQPDLPSRDTPPRAAAVARPAAYRRLALTILGLDVPTLAAELRAQRTARGRPAHPLSPPTRRAA
jgi:hypothetical protein